MASEHVAEWLKPWTTGPCDECGCNFHLTRAVARQRRERELCEGCEAYAQASAEADAQITALQAENAGLRARAERAERRRDAMEPAVEFVRYHREILDLEAEADRILEALDDGEEAIDGR